MLNSVLVRLGWLTVNGLRGGMFDQAVQDSSFEGLARRFSGGIGGSILHLSETDSTMDVAKEFIETRSNNQNLHGKVIVAEQQRQGRGRFGRTWFSGPGQDILMSCILCPRLAVTGQITIMASLAAAMTVDDLSGKTSAIKWPNDVLVDGKKICGVIAESYVIGEVFFGVVGIGLNVNTLPSADEEKDFSATSMRELMPLMHCVDRVDVLETMLVRMNELYDALERGESILPEWREKLETLGREIEVSMVDRDNGNESETICGIAEDVDYFGRLLIRGFDGTTRAVSSGEVTAREDLGADRKTHFGEG